MIKTKKLLATFLATALVLSGCGAKIKDAPELIDPASANEAYRPAVIGTVGLSGYTSGIVMGEVVPKEYCHFYKASVMLSSVDVSVGDYVNEGDVLATADVEEAAKVRDLLSKKLSNLSTVKDAEDKIYELKKESLSLEIENTTDEKVQEEKKLAEKVLDENKRFDDLMYAHNVSDLREEISKQQEIVADGTLKARVSGYVTYVRDISKPNINVAENVVVVANQNDCYIEVKDVASLGLGKLSDFEVSKYSLCYTYIDGAKEKLVEYPYSNDEKAVAESKNSIPPVRLKPENQNKQLIMGSNVPIFAVRDGSENVVRICKDSLYKDENGDYVYVKTGDTTKEKRYVKLGCTDRNYAEVVSGISEGEMIYYTSEQVMPVEYSEYKVEKSDYEAFKDVSAYNIKDTVSINYQAKYDGVVKEVYVKTGDSVSVGDKLCLVETDLSGALLSEMAKGMSELRDGHDAAIKALEEREAEIDKQLEALNKKPKKHEKKNKAATNSDAFKSDEDIPAAIKIKLLNIEKEVVEQEKRKETSNFEASYAELSQNYQAAAKGNDGRGNITIYSENDGVVGTVWKNANATVLSGEQLVYINIPCEKFVAINSSSANVGQTITFEAPEGKIYYGKVVGSTGTGEQKFYVTTTEDKVYVTTSVSNGSTACYIKMEDESFYNIKNASDIKVNFSERSIPNSIVIPRAGIVYTEIDRSTLENRSYVWKLVEGSPVKTYITVANEDIGGSTFCVIEGLDEGDILASNYSEEEEEK